MRHITSWPATKHIAKVLLAIKFNATSQNKYSRQSLAAAFMFQKAREVIIHLFWFGDDMIYDAYYLVKFYVNKMAECIFRRRRRFEYDKLP